MVNKEEIQKLRDYATKRFTEESLDKSDCKLDNNLSYEDNISKIELFILTQQRDKKKQEIQEELDRELIKNPSIDFIKDKIEREFISFEQGEKNLLYIYGSQGTSKSTSLRHIFLERGFKEDIDFIFLGYTPTYKLFEKFSMNKNIKFIVIDDAQGIFKNDISRGMFLQAVDDKKIRNIYYDGGIKPLLPILDFKPKIIFISNEMIPYENILSRARVVQILLNYEKRLKYAEEVLKNKGANEMETTLIIQHIKEKTGRKKIPFDFRICKELLEDLRFNPKWKDKTILDERTTIMLQCVENNIGTKQAVENWSKITGLGIRQGWRVLKGVDI